MNCKPGCVVVSFQKSLLFTGFGSPFAAHPNACIGVYQIAILIITIMKDTAMIGGRDPPPDIVGNRAL